MRPAPEPNKRLHISVGFGLCLFLSIAIFFLWQEHRAHILGLLPYALLLACPVIHLFMHHGHDNGSRRDSGHGDTRLRDLGKGKQS